jgi:hypothetical protein
VVQVVLRDADELRIGPVVGARGQRPVEPVRIESDDRSCDSSRSSSILIIASDNDSVPIDLSPVPSTGRAAG